MNIRSATREDVSQIAQLMHTYMSETYSSTWYGSEDAVLQDGFGRHFNMQVAVAGPDRLLGLACWRSAYDFHHCMLGGEVIDMFVTSPSRGKGIGPALVCAVAAQVQQQGGCFLRGQAVEDASVRKLYGRVAVTGAAVECTVSGRAFRAVAALASQPAKVIVRTLPAREWNYEA